MGVDRKVWSIYGFIPFVFLVALIAIAFINIINSPKASAQSSQEVCRAAIIIDRSSSVSYGQHAQMRAQIQRLFQPAGLYSDNVELAFWTFSNTFYWAVGTSDYNTPSHGFVSTKGQNSSFNNQLGQIKMGTLTNYEQGFGYNLGVRNPALNNIIEAADILVFMTDGLPNQPQRGTPRQIGRDAALKHINAGRAILGASLDSNPRQRQTINYVVSGNENNSRDTFDVQFNNLAVKLKEEISKKCYELFPPCPYDPSLPLSSPDCQQEEYSVRPAVSVTPSAVSPGESVRYDYVLTGEKGTPKDTTWNSIGLRVNAGVDISSLKNLSNGYADTNAGNLAGVRNEILGRIGGQASIISDTPSGVWKRAGVPAEDFVVPESAQAGEKFCRILVVTKPTQRTNPAYRYSTIACVTVGFKPSLQVLGGDVITGRTILGNEPALSTQSKIHTSLSTVGGKSYGSFGEYALRASGPITGMASISALKQGVAVGDGATMSRLTFANTPSTGWFNETQPEYMPDTAVQLLQKYDEALAPRVSGNVTPRDSMNGLYVASGNIELESYQLRVGQTIVIYAPRNTVTINGNITSTTDPLSKLEDIPQFIIIANKINIKSAATQIDSWLMARGEDAGIDTCSDAPAQLTASTCNQPLTVNGPVMAKYLQLKRTAGGNAASGVAAETFNMRAHAYMWAYQAMRNDRRIMTTHTIELAPRF